MKKIQFNSYELSKKLKRLDEIRKTERLYTSVSKNGIVPDDNIIRKIHKCGMICGVRL